MTDSNLIQEPKMLYSMQELADFLGCSTVTAQRFKNNGRIPFYQVGRKCFFNTEKILQALEHNPTKKLNRA